jgi:pyruvate/2-oxoglutarate dehydrogenase complex dihydrolipoamide dehydrogenase (E3) component
LAFEKAVTLKSCTTQVTYLNEYASFEDPHTVKTVDKNGTEKTVTASTFILATGGRPKYPEIPGAREFGITSDDLVPILFNSYLAEKLPGIYLNLLA